MLFLSVVYAIGSKVLNSLHKKKVTQKPVKLKT